MQDRVSLYPGRVKLVPVEGQENTYDMVRADEPTQGGDPLSKATFLKDDTAALFGLGADAVPDDALKILSRLHTHLGDYYLWRKQSISGEIKEATESSSLGRMSDNETYYYYDSVQLDLANKKIVGVGEHIIANQSYGSSEWNKVIGKYMLYPYDKGSWPPNTFYRVTDRPISTDAIFTAYAEYVEFTLGPAQYLNSPNADAYPSGVVGDVQYDALGKIGGLLTLGVHIETGSYVGTGTNGLNNPNSLTFDFVPKLVVVSGQGGSSSAVAGFIYCWGSTKYTLLYDSYSGARTTCEVSLADKTMNWYDIKSVYFQCNDSGYVFNYIAIG